MAPGRADAHGPHGGPVAHAALSHARERVRDGFRRERRRSVAERFRGVREHAAFVVDEGALDVRRAEVQAQITHCFRSASTASSEDYFFRSASTASSSARASAAWAAARSAAFSTAASNCSTAMRVAVVEVLEASEASFILMLIAVLRAPH